MRPILVQGVQNQSDWATLDDGVAAAAREQVSSTSEADAAALDQAQHWGAQRGNLQTQPSEAISQGLSETKKNVLYETGTKSEK